MIVGHAMVGFVVSVMIARKLSMSRDQQLAVGLTAMAFAVLPDFDLIVGVIGVVESGLQGISQTQQEFWTDGLKYHRGLTHSILFGLVSATIFSLISYGDRNRLLGLALAIVVLLISAVSLGVLQSIVVFSYIISGIVITLIVRKYNDMRNIVVISSFTGVITHPFGDVFTGTSPQLLSPLSINVLPDIVLVSQEPTLHLLFVFILELSTVWAFVYTYLKINEESVWTYIPVYTMVGVLYGFTSMIIQPPTLEVSYHFVFSIIALGFSVMMVEAYLHAYKKQNFNLKQIQSLLISGLGVVTVSLISYLIGYIILFS